MTTAAARPSPAGWDRPPNRSPSASAAHSTFGHGHKSTHVTEAVYRHVIVPAIRGGASVMDSVFSDHDADGDGGKAGSQ